MNPRLCMMRAMYEKHCSFSDGSETISCFRYTYMIEGSILDMSTEERTFFELIYQKTNQKILSYMIARCRSIADVSDLFQDTYLDFALIIRKKGISYFQEPEAFVMQLAKRRLQRFYRFQKRHQVVFLQDYDLDEKEEDFYNETIVEDDYIKRETFENAKKVIDSLDITTQKILYLHFFTDQTMKEIAILLEENESTVKSRMYRALRYIKKEIEED